MFIPVMEIMESTAMDIAVALIVAVMILMMINVILGAALIK
jgi:hypothetical protein